jgi:hypothetical protein
LFNHDGAAARQREKAGKLYPPAIKRLVSLHMAEKSNRQWSKDWSHRNPGKLRNGEEQWVKM